MSGLRSPLDLPRFKLTKPLFQFSDSLRLLLQTRSKTKRPREAQEDRHDHADGDRNQDDDYERTVELPADELHDRLARVLDGKVAMATASTKNPIRYS